jgi:malate dehydrogenase
LNGTLTVNTGATFNVNALNAAITIGGGLTTVGTGAFNMGSTNSSVTVTGSVSNAGIKRPGAKCSKCGYEIVMFKKYLEIGAPICPKDIQAMLLGGHGDTMVPLPRYTTVSGIPVTELIDADKLDAIIERTKKGGGELVNLMGTSAWYAPGAAAAQMVEAIVRDQKRIFPCCALLNGEYGLNNIYLGVPVKLGKNGIEQIIELQLNADEKKLLTESAAAVKEVMDVYDAMVNSATA